MLKTPSLMRLVDGRVLPIWSDCVRLPLNLDVVIAYMFKDRPAAEAGDCERGATAFWTGAQTAAGPIPYLVTNRHVIEDGTTTVRIMDQSRRSAVIETTETDWVFHSNPNVDLAIATLNIPANCHVTILPSDALISVNDESALDMRMGDDVCMVGRHLNYDGKLMNLPTSRFGHLVQLPGDPIRDERGREYPAFLVQIPSLPGFSGSPVFLIQDESEKNAEHGSLVLGPNPRNVRLLGVNAGHIPAFSPTYTTGGGIRNPHLEAEINSGISVVVPAWALRDLLNEDLRRRRPSITIRYS